MFVWNYSMATGVEKVDAQHHELINRFNDLLEAEERGADHATIGHILGFIQDYAEHHFKTEEDIMERLKCPAADRNKKAHNEFRAKFDQIRVRWQNSSTAEPVILHETIVALANWIVNHILTVDNELHHYVK